MTGTYRAWCLSWDDDEEAGMDIVSVDALTLASNKAPRRGLIEVYCSIDAKDAAETYADYVHDQRDGCESSWPLEFRVRCPDGTIQDFSVDRDYSPTFRASAVKSQVPKVAEVPEVPEGPEAP